VHKCTSASAFNSSNIILTEVATKQIKTPQLDSSVKMEEIRPDSHGSVDCVGIEETLVRSQGE